HQDLARVGEHLLAALVRRVLEFLHDLLQYLPFFFSSRRRHTRCYRDWSSDVCSSDLRAGMSRPTRTIVDDPGYMQVVEIDYGTGMGWIVFLCDEWSDAEIDILPTDAIIVEQRPVIGQDFIRSEERRVGKAGASHVATQ